MRITRVCVTCGREYVAGNSRSRTCGDACRKRRSRGAVAMPEVETGNSLVQATRRELEDVGKVDTMLGQQALALAARMSGTETPGGIASISRELRTVMAAVVGPAAKGPAKQDSVDELRARRDAKRTG